MVEYLTQQEHKILKDLHLDQMIHTVEDLSDFISHQHEIILSPLERLEGLARYRQAMIALGYLSSVASSQDHPVIAVSDVTLHDRAFFKTFSVNVGAKENV